MVCVGGGGGIFQELNIAEDGVLDAVHVLGRHPVDEVPARLCGPQLQGNWIRCAAIHLVCSSIERELLVIEMFLDIFTKEKDTRGTKILFINKIYRANSSDNLLKEVSH